jgi:hypothetical protein
MTVPAIGIRNLQQVPCADGAATTRVAARKLAILQASQGHDMSERIRWHVLDRCGIPQIAVERAGGQHRSKS